MDTFCKSDPFVEVLIVPGEHVEMKTKIIKNNLNPVLNNEVFKTEFSQRISYWHMFCQVYIWRCIWLGSCQVIKLKKFRDWKWKTICFHIGTSSLWKLNLSLTTDDLKVLHEFTGTKNKPSLKVGLQPSTSFTDC